MQGNGHERTPPPLTLTGSGPLLTRARPAPCRRSRRTGTGRTAHVPRPRPHSSPAAAPRNNAPGQEAAVFCNQSARGHHDVHGGGICMWLCHIPCGRALQAAPNHHQPLLLVDFPGKRPPARQTEEGQTGAPASASRGNSPTAYTLLPTLPYRQAVEVQLACRVCDHQLAAARGPVPVHQLQRVRPAAAPRESVLAAEPARCACACACAGGWLACAPHLGTA